MISPRICTHDGADYRAKPAQYNGRGHALCDGCAAEGHSEAARHLCRMLADCCACDRADARDVVWVRREEAGTSAKEEII